MINFTNCNNVESSNFFVRIFDAGAENFYTEGSVLILTWLRSLFTNCDCGFTESTYGFLKQNAMRGMKFLLFWHGLLMWIKKSCLLQKKL